MGNTPESVWTSSQLIDSLTEKAQIFIFAYSPQKKTLVAWSNNANKILGVRDADIATDGNLFLRHMHPDDRFTLLADLENALADGLEYRATYRWIRPDTDELRWLHCRGKLSATDEEQKIFDGVIVDLTSEFTGHVARIAGPDSLSTILSAFPTLIFTLDKDLRIVRLNRPASLTTFDFADPEFHHENFAVGRLFSSCFPENSQSQFLLNYLFEVMEDKKSHFRTRIDSHGAIYSLEVLALREKSGVTGVLVIISDISENVKLEREIAKLNKAEGIRVFASGVTDNLNNSLQSILGHAAAIRDNSRNPELAAGSAQAIMEIVERASGLARQLISLDPPQADTIGPVDVNLAVMAAAHKIDSLFSNGFRLSVAFGSPPPAASNHEKLVSSLVEILEKASQKNPLENSFTIRTYQTNLETDQAKGLPAGSYVKIVISNSGPALAGEHEAVAASMRKLGGAIFSDSHTRTGSSISIILPVQNGYIDRQFDRELFSHPPDARPEVLIIDDDLMVLQTVKQIIESTPLQCVVAADAKRAIKLARRFRGELKLVLIDSLMPGLNGANLLKRIKKINGRIKAVGFSGASSDVTNELNQAGAITVLKKPVEPHLLKTTILSIINAKEAA